MLIDLDQLQQRLYINWSMVHAFQFLILLLSISTILGSQKCQNNATYIEKSDLCSCQPNYVGKDCNITAYELKQTDTKIPVSKDYTYAYFTPQEKVIYRFLLTFCPVDKSQQLQLLVFAQEEQKDGDIQLSPKKQRETVGLEIGGNKDCKQILSTVLVSVDKKLNDELVRIVFGIKLSGKYANLTNQYILLKCQTNSIFTVSFLATILISFLVIITVFFIISAIFLIRKKFLQRRAEEQLQMKKMNCVNSLMPQKKYETLVQQQTNQYDLICSICLSEFEKGQDIRETPCGHIYHSKCLQSWCNAHLNCPICRKDFEKQEEQQKQKQIQQVLRPQTNNIRQPIL